MKKSNEAEKAAEEFVKATCESVLDFDEYSANDIKDFTRCDFLAGWEAGREALVESAKQLATDHTSGHGQSDLAIWIDDLVKLLKDT